MNRRQLESKIADMQIEIGDMLTRLQSLRSSHLKLLRRHASLLNHLGLEQYTEPERVVTTERPEES